MKKIGQIFMKAENILIILSLVLMLILIFVATFFRFARIPAIVWSEELARVLMIWMALLGAGTIARDGSHFSVNVLFTLFSDNKKRIFFTIILISILVFCMFIFYFGINNCVKQYYMGQISPGMRIPMWILFLSVPFCAVSVGIQSCIYFIPLITGQKKYSSDTSL